MILNVSSKMWCLRAMENMECTWGYKYLQVYVGNLVHIIGHELSCFKSSTKPMILVWLALIWHWWWWLGSLPEISLFSVHVSCMSTFSLLGKCIVRLSHLRSWVKLPPYGCLKIKISISCQIEEGRWGSKPSSCEVFPFIFPQMFNRTRLFRLIRNVS